MWSWSVADGHLGIAGGGRSGRTTAVLTVAVQLAAGLSPAALHLYAIGPADLVTPRGVAAHRRRWPTSTTRSRCAWSSSASPGCLDMTTTQRARCSSWTAGSGSAGHGHGGLAAQVRSLLEGSGTTGLRAVVTGGRALLAGQLVPVLPQRLVLALGDPVELAMAGIPGRAVPVRQPPGRALDARTHREVHIATLEGDPTAAAGVVAERWARCRLGDHPSWLAPADPSPPGHRHLAARRPDESQHDGLVVGRGPRR